MGYSLTPYAVDLSKITALVGSKDKHRLARLLKLFGNQDSEAEDAGEGSPGASTADALRHLIMGQPYDARVAYKYGYVLEFLCRHFGEELMNACWCDLRDSHLWFESLDTQLEEAGVSTERLSVNKHLANRGSPIPMPPYNDFPEIGYLTAEEVGPALEALLKAKFDDIGDEEEEDEELWLPTEFEEIRSWLEICVETDRDLVCFSS